LPFQPIRVFFGLLKWQQKKFMKQFTLDFIFEDNDYAAEITETISRDSIHIYVKQTDQLLADRFGWHQMIIMKPEGHFVPVYESALTWAILKALVNYRNEYPGIRKK
jgi:hypothetical protein